MTIFSIVLFIFFIVISGTLITYFLFDHFSLFHRVIAGVFLGSAIEGYIGFGIAKVGGLSIATVIVSTVLTFFPVLIVAWKYKRKQIKNDYLDIKSSLKKFNSRPFFYKSVVLFFIFLLICVLVNVISGGAYEIGGIIGTRSSDNLSDLTLHVGMISGFVYGHNFLPEHPDFAGTKLTYPFLINFITSQFVFLGLSIIDAIFITNLLYIFGIIVLLALWGQKLIGSKFSFFATPALILLSGGIGFIEFFGDFQKRAGSIMDFLFHLPADYTHVGHAIRWGNPIVYWLIPMRSMLLGIPLVLIVSLIWWQQIVAHKKKATKNDLIHMVFAGLIAGLLPLSHTHSLFVLLAAAVIFFIIFRPRLPWVFFLMSALIVSFPQFLWMQQRSLIITSTFFGFMKSWISEEPNIFILWWLNSGLFIPVTLLGFFHPKIGNLQLKKFIFPFMLFFLLANFVRMAPWDWDNIKILVYWYIFTTPLAVLTIHYFWKKGNFAQRVVIILAFISLIFSGSLDIWRVVAKTNNWTVFDEKSMHVADVIRISTPPRMLILHAPILHNPVLLTGRQSFMGYPGRLWTHGLTYFERENDVKEIYQGAARADQLLRDSHIEAVVIGPQERIWANEQKLTLNEEYFRKFPPIFTDTDVTIYKIQ